MEPRTEIDRLPLRDAGDWWRIVLGSGLRRTATGLDEAEAARVRATCERFIRKRGIRHLELNSHYAIASRTEDTTQLWN